MIEQDALTAQDELGESPRNFTLEKDMPVLFKGVSLTVAKVEEDKIHFQREGGYTFAILADKVQDHFRNGVMDLAA